MCSIPYKIANQGVRATLLVYFVPSILRSPQPIVTTQQLKWLSQNLMPTLMKKRLEQMPKVVKRPMFHVEFLWNSIITPYPYCSYKNSIMVNSGLWSWAKPSISGVSHLNLNTRSKPPNNSKSFKIQTLDARVNNVISRALWCVTHGLAVAPPGIVWT